MIIVRSGWKEHFDATYARTLGAPAMWLFLSHVLDFIKMAFMASAVYITEIRLEGLVVLCGIIKVH